MPKFIFNKLVRDKLHDEYLRVHEAAEFRELNDAEYNQALIAKIVEEAKEIPADASRDDIISELADVQQAIDDFMKLHGIEVGELSATQKTKFDQKGGFGAKNFVVSLTLDENDTWVDYYRAKPDVFPEVSDTGIIEDVPLIEAGTYEHYKGKSYEVVGVGLDSETSKPVVVYVPLYESKVPFFVRPYEMFLGFVDVDGKKVRRFKKVV